MSAKNSTEISINLLKFVQKYLFILAIIITIATGYYIFSAKGKKQLPEVALEKISHWEKPFFKDDLSKDSLITVIKRNLKYLEKLPENRVFTYGDLTYTASDVVESYDQFLFIVQTSKDNSELTERILHDFDIFRSSGSDGKGKVLFTGYYEPIIKGSLTKTDVYRFPIYKRPYNLISINLGNFRKSLKGKTISARIKDNSILPFYDRHTIDHSGALSGKGLEIAWLSDPLDAFFLQVQGSGIISMENGEKMNVNYAGTNGKDYRSIGRLLINEDKVPKEKMSMKAIRNYLTSHPEEMERVLNYNKSYIFFRTVEKGPIGSIGVQVSAGRSIATDPKLFPKGGLAFLTTEIPITDNDGTVVKWKKTSRFVIDQDIGGAIKGAGRADIFFGTGDNAGRQGGAMNREGKLFYLVKKKNLG